MDEFTLIEKYFKRKPTDKQLSSFIAELMFSNKGNYTFESNILTEKNHLRARREEKRELVEKKFSGKVAKGYETTTYLELLKARVPGMNVIGFFIAGSGKSGRVDKRSLYYLLPGDSYTETMEKVKFLNKNKYLAITSLGYDEYYVLPGGNSLEITDEGLGDELVGASKAKLKTAFGKSMKGKISSRPLLNKFIKLVA